MIPNMSEEIINKQKSLQPGTCVAFGRILKIPMIIKMEKQILRQVVLMLIYIIIGC